MANLAKYIVQLEAQTSKYVAELDKANKQLTRFNNHQESVVKNITHAFHTLAGVIGLHFFEKLVESTVKAGAELVTLSQKVGVSIEALQGMQAAASMADVEAQDLQQGLVRLSASMVTAAEKGKNADTAFSELGVAVVDSNGKLRSVEAVVRDVADAFQNMADGAKKTALAREMFSRGGAQLIPFLNEGSEGIDEMTEKMRQLGALWTGESARAMHKFEDDMKLLKMAGSGFAMTLTTEIEPGMDAFVNALVDMSTKTGAAKELAAGLAKIFQFLATAAIAAAYGMVGLAHRIAGSLAAVTALFTDGLDAARGVIAELALDQIKLEKQMNESMASVWNATKTASDGVDNLSNSERENEDQVEANIKQADELVKSLELEMNTFGMTRTQATMYKLELMGANDAQKELALGALNAINALEKLKARIATTAERRLKPGEQGPVPDETAEPGLDELANMNEMQRQQLGVMQETSKAIADEYKYRRDAARQYAQEELQMIMQSQIQQLDFRASMAQQAAALLQGLFGQSKAIQLAAIAFEKLANVKRTKMAWDLAAVQAFQSQLIPGWPPSYAMATRAYLATKAQGAVALAQAVAFNVLSGLAEAAQVVNSSGQPGSFTNPVSTTGGSSAAAATVSSAAASRKQSGVQVTFLGDFYGFDDYLKAKLIGALKDAVNGRDVVIIGPNSRQADILRTPT